MDTQLARATAWNVPDTRVLAVLAREGLRVESGTRGYLVRIFTRIDMLDAIDLRGVLEGFAVRRIAERGASPGLLQQLQECLEEGAGSSAGDTWWTAMRPPMAP